jgi:mitochondrial fission protein ELM1
MPHPHARKRILIISDGKPGHQNQSLGLVEALQRLDPSIEFDIEAPLAFFDVMASLCKLKKLSESALTYAIVIGAGHRTHLTVWLRGRQQRAKTLICMKPSLPMGLFDLCIVPQHDHPVEKPNVMATQGVMNRIQPGLKQPDFGLVLIGGPSKHHQWDDTSVVSQLKQMVRDDSVSDNPHHWVLTTSRRTPDTFLPTLAQANLNISVIPHTQTDAGWLPEQLGKADQCWVSEDSVSMIYEALTAGCQVGLLALANQGGGRVVDGVLQLKAEGRVFTLASKNTQANSLGGLAEADRVAAYVRSLGWV